MKKSKGLFIGEASSQCGISVKQLRTWTDQGLIDSPQYVTCGERTYRVYNGTHIEQIKRIKQYLDEGYTLKTAAFKASKNMHQG